MHVMFDSVDLTQIPKTAHAVAGYVGGAWPTDSHNALRAKYPHAYVASIATARTQRASFADVEPGNLTVPEGVEWLLEGLDLKEDRPGLYAPFADMLEICAELDREHVLRSEYRLWLATDDGLADAVDILLHRTHLGQRLPAGVSIGAVQYDWHCFGRDLDVSLCQPWFFTKAESPLGVQPPPDTSPPA